MSEENPNNGNEMSFLGHLEELRWRLVRSAIAIVIVAIVLFVFTEVILDTVYFSMMKTDFPTYRFFCWFGELIGMDDTMCVQSINIEKLQSTEMSSQFNTNMYYAIVGGVIVSFPFIFHQFWGFFKPALRQQELSVSKGVIFYASFLFFLGVAFGYFVISPLCVQFFGNYTMHSTIVNQFRPNSYISLITTSTLLSGLFFELPIVVYFLSKVGVVSPELLKRYRKHAIVVVLVLSAIITPPDVVSQILVAVPIMILYEIGIKISGRVLKQKSKSV